MIMKRFAIVNVRRSSGAFTLVELLISFGVLALLILLVSQLMNSATAVTRTGSKHIDTDTQARVILDRMALDFAKMLKRIPGMTILGGRQTKVQHRDLYYVLGKAKLVRNKNEHEYLIVRIMLRAPKRKLRATATFKTAYTRIDEAMPVIERFMDTFSIVDVKSADKALHQLGIRED